MESGEWRVESGEWRVESEESVRRVRRVRRERRERRERAVQQTDRVGNGQVGESPSAPPAEPPHLCSRCGLGHADASCPHAVFDIMIEEEDAAASSGTSLEPGGCTAFRSHFNTNMPIHPARGRCREKRG